MGGESQRRKNSGLQIYDSLQEIGPFEKSEPNSGNALKKRGFSDNFLNNYNVGGVFETTQPPQKQF